MNIKHSGFAAIIGRPNVGKSTLINQLIGQKISITTDKPQTTRWQILGVHTTEEAQVIYIDTPGLHAYDKKAVNRYMNRVARAVIKDADILLFMIEATKWREEDELVLKELKSAEKPVILILNKVDLLADKSKLLPMIDGLKERFPFVHIIPISALKNKNVERLEKEIIALLPEGGALYPIETKSDKPQNFQVAEIIREKIIDATHEELPYATSVAIEQFAMTENLAEIGAIIWVERPGQKKIIIGKRGEMLKKIGTMARLDLEKQLGQKVYLRLWVKVKANWADDEKALRTFGYE